jgi:hypothetical protein
MYINLNDFIYYMMDFGSKPYFCFDNYECYYEDENDIEVLNENSSCVIIPQIDETIVIRAFIAQERKPKLTKLLNNPLDLLHNFHNQINDLGLYDEWDSFCEEYYLREAAQWCESNGIKFTRKKTH